MKAELFRRSRRKAGMALAALAMLLMPVEAVVQTLAMGNAPSEAQSSGPAGTPRPGASEAASGPPDSARDDTTMAPGLRPTMRPELAPEKLTEEALRPSMHPEKAKEAPVEPALPPATR
jgi:hypothetical protein